MNKTNLRPLLHITGDNGWINDPNGLVYFKGKYHVFYQYYPNDIHWGPMHWGHKISTDLIHWEKMPIALFPDDETGCFSGSAIVKDDKLYLIYTGFYENEGGDTIRQKQKLAYSEDGIAFKKIGIIIDESNLPKGYSPIDFRDPYVYKKDDKFYCIIACKKIDGKGRILLFSSSDLMKWKFVSDIFDKDSLGTMIECPAYNEKLGLLIFSEQFQPSENNIHLNIHTSRWKTGRINYKTGKFEEIESGICDYGFDFYAPTLFYNADVMIGWLNMWDRNIPSEKYGFAGMLTIPRNVSIINNKLVQTPIYEGELIESTQINNNYFNKLKFGMISLDIEKLEKFEIKLRKNINCCTVFKLLNDEWIFDRSQSGEIIVGKEKDEDSLCGVRRMPYIKQSNHKILIVIDEFSVEIFVDGRSLSSTIYPDQDAIDFEVKVIAEHCLLELRKNERN